MKQNLQIPEEKKEDFNRACLKNITFLSVILKNKK